MLLLEIFEVIFRLKKSKNRTKICIFNGRFEKSFL